MKNQNSFLLTLLFVVFTVFSYSQNNCKVLVSELNGTYVGKCKKGLAHGNGAAVGTDSYVGNFKKGLPNGSGTYTWASGATYDGDWVSGERDGHGVYKFKYEGADSIQEGEWNDGIFIGKKPRKPLVTNKEFVTRYNFRRDGDGDRILVDLKRNGQINSDILDFSMISSNGAYFKMGRSHGLETIIFPVVVKIRYLTWNQMGTMRHVCTFEFEIFEPGNWQVDIVN